MPTFGRPERALAGRRVLFVAGCRVRVPARSIDRGADAFDLATMEQIVAGVQLLQVTDALFAALGVQADALQIGRRRADRKSVV